MAPQRLPSVAVAARTHDVWQQAVVGSGDSRGPEGLLDEILRPLNFHDGVRAAPVTEPLLLELPVPTHSGRTLCQTAIPKPDSRHARMRAAVLGHMRSVAESCFRVGRIQRTLAWRPRHADN